MGDIGYQLVIGAKFDGVNYTYLHLDTCMEKNITASSVIPTQPLQDGNTMSDHMYRNPDEFTVTGTFSLFGAKRDNQDYNDIPEISSAGDRLTNIQTVFEYIKDNGILCDLTTIEEGESGSVRFKQRKNMALYNINWKENQVSMNYTFTFKEIICVDMQEYDVEINEDLPNIFYPSAKSIGQILIEESATDGISPYAKIVLQSLIKNGYIENAIARYCYLAGTSMRATALGLMQSIVVEAIGAIAAIAITTSIVTGLATAGIISATAATSAIFPVGTIIGASIGFVLGIALIVHNVNNKKRELAKKEKMFNLVDNIGKYINNNGVLDESSVLADSSVKINQDELDRLYYFLTKVKNIILDTTDNCQVYQLSTGPEDNNDREVVIVIGGNPYYIKFIKDPTSNYGWQTQVLTPGAVDDIPLDGSNGTLMNGFLPVASLDEMDINVNCFFRDVTRKYEVYLYNPSLNSEVNNQEEVENAKQYLSGYQLIVSYGHIKENVDKIYKAINDEIVNGGYV